MNIVDFKSGIKRLNLAFGNFYNTERENALWDEFKSFQLNSWKILVDTAIRNLAKAPTVMELAGLAAEIRESVYSKNREQEKRDAHAFWSSSYHPEEVKWIVNNIRRRLSHTIPDGEWKEFMAILKQRADDEENRERSSKFGSAIKPNNSLI